MPEKDTCASLPSLASAFLASARLEARLSGFTHFVTGSYALGTMAWPDIDVNVLYEPAKREDIYALGAEYLAQLAPSWFELRCTEEEADSPGHFFLGFEVAWNGALWNVDIWFLSEPEYEAGARWLRETDAKLTPENRQTVIDLKCFLIARGAYPNGIPSIDVYNAVLDRHLQPAGFEQWFHERRGKG